jgi:hypothetical protein
MKVKLTESERAIWEEAMASVDWARLDAMTDEEIEAAAASDPDNPPMTDEELAELTRLAAEKRAGRGVAAE